MKIQEDSACVTFNRIPAATGFCFDLWFLFFAFNVIDN